MKRLFIYLFPVLAVTVAGCSESGRTFDPEGATGTLTMKISTRSETEQTGYDPTEYLTIRIYNGNGEMIRKYTSKADLPERLELIAGEYRVAVEAGEAVAASFTQRYYKGEEPFTVTPGENTSVEVKCTQQNTAVATVFDETIRTNFGTDCAVRVMPGAAYDETRADDPSTLRYTEDATGYFLLDEGCDALAWQFSGTHASRGTITQTGIISEVRSPGRYTLTFRYSPDLPGYIEAVAIRVDDTTDDFDDTIIWSPDPTIEGNGFELSEIQQYQGGEKGFNVSTVKPMVSSTLTFAGKTYDLLAAISTPVAGLAVEKTGENTLIVTLSDDFFTGCPGGNQTLRFEVTDNSGGHGVAECVFALQGIMDPSAADYDLWRNTVTLRARVFENVSAVTFGLRTEGGAWQELAGTNAGDGIWTATLGTEWVESTNENGQTVYTPKAGTGVWAEGKYECRAVIDGQESLTSFSTAGGQSIPGGDMEDGSMSCFNNNHGSFWDSGNNSMSDPLCIQSSFSGMGGSHCARLQANKPFLLVNLAAGNLFTGVFELATPDGKVHFGQSYDWQARPQKMHVLYYAEVLGQVNQNQHTGPLATGSQDKARIYVAIVDWNTPHSVISGSNDPVGVWDPAKGIYGGDNATQASGKIIAYGSYFIEKQSSGGQMIPLDIPLHYYDTETKPSGSYTLVISCATSAYGDFMNGCTSNVLYVDDFQWVY